MEYSIEEVNRKVEDNIPSLSPTASKVIQIANDINSPPGELTKVIKLDPVLSAKVIKLVNSSYFALSNRIVALEKAVIMLGLNTIKNLALSAAVLTQMESQKNNPPFDKDLFWKHSLAVGVVARMIARERGIPKKMIEDYFLGGMLHDLGLLVESTLYPEEMETVCMASPGNGIIETEEVALEGLNHCVIGKVLGEKWKLSNDLIDVIANHHKIEECGQNELGLTVYLANIICKNNKKGLVLDKVPVSVDPSIYKKLELSEGIEGKIMEGIEGEINKAREFLKV